MTTAHFQNLSDSICRRLAEARQHIRIAVCWFSHKDIFETLLARLRSGACVELLLEYDSQNIRDDGLDFQQFIRAGGHLYAHREAGLMHHKFALIDSRLLLTGSFNWTYNSNAENLLVLDDAAMVSAFLEEFERQKAGARRIFTVQRADVKVFSAFPLFENTQFHLSDLRKKVSGGAGVWLVRADKPKIDNTLIFREHRLPFDAAGLLRPYWSAYRMWDEKLFEAEMERLKSGLSAFALRDLRCWARRMKTGDIVLAARRKTQLAAVGIVQSHPQPFAGEGFSSFREVQWVKILEGTPFHLEQKSLLWVAKFRGSALKLLNEVFNI